MRTDLINAKLRATATGLQVGGMTLVTADATSTEADSYLPMEESVGEIRVLILGTTLALATYVGIKRVSYKKTAGVVTLLGTVATEFENVEYGMTGVATDIVAAGDKVSVEVTGLVSEVKWSVKAEVTELINDLIAP